MKEIILILLIFQDIKKYKNILFKIKNELIKTVFKNFYEKYENKMKKLYN